MCNKPFIRLMINLSLQNKEGGVCHMKSIKKEIETLKTDRLAVIALIGSIVFLIWLMFVHTQIVTVNAYSSIVADSGFLDRDALGAFIVDVLTIAGVVLAVIACIVGVTKIVAKGKQ